MANFPVAYRAFFLWIEPMATLVGAIYAWFFPLTYLELTRPHEAHRQLGLPTATEVALRQLGNMYMVFAFSEAFVLRATNDVKVWRVLLLNLLIADFGHLYSCWPLGVDVYWDVRKWSAIDYGSVLFVYCGAATRTCFFTGVGMGGPKKAQKQARRSIKAASEEIEEMTPASLNKTPAQSTRRRKNKSRS